MRDSLPTVSENQVVVFRDNAAITPSNKTEQALA
jgi:hypothetical protein